MGQISYWQKKFVPTGSGANYLVGSRTWLNWLETTVSAWVKSNCCPVKPKKHQHKSDPCKGTHDNQTLEKADRKRTIK
jgi:hypothetical protein